MQGRLSSLMDGRIQAFPWSCWREEFVIGESNGFGVMEWTLDQDRLYENPLLTSNGKSEIRALCKRHGFTVSSLTGDCFMQAPFWKAQGGKRKDLQRDFTAVAEACAATGIEFIVVPLVDNGRLENSAQEDVLVTYLEEQANYFIGRGLKVAFESDFVPNQLARFIDRLDPACFGVNYDIGNSAALGFLPAEEFDAYGDRIVNVHIKDRPVGGTTVSLGTGDADFESVFSHLARLEYRGNYILQTARAADDDHAGLLNQYRRMSEEWIARYES